MSKFSSFLRILSVCVLFLALFLGVGCKKSTVIDAGMIVAGFSQTEWSLDYTNSSGELQVFLSGEGVLTIRLDSIEMRGDNSNAAPLKALSALLDGNQVTAVFARNRVMELLANPSDGSSHTVIISFFTNESNNRKEVSAQVTVSAGSDNPVDVSKLSLEVEPEEWSLNYPKSSGTVEAFIEGEGIDNIDLNSVQLKGDNEDAQPLDADSVSINGNKIHARFPKNQVIGLLNDPEEGSTHQLTLLFKAAGSDQLLELTAMITIEDEDDVIDPGDLELEIEPEEWSLNYSKSSGTVEAFIEGEGVENIDMSTITMSGDNPAATPLSAQSVSFKGGKIHARFPKNQVLDLLLNPEEGSTHTITITFMTTDNQEIQLTAVITIEEDDDDDGGGGNELPKNLSLDLAPDHWNFNFSNGGGNVNAFIRGDGLSSIDLETLEMSGDSSADPLAAVSAKLEGEHVKGKFAKDQLFDLLLNPQTGSTHTITVTFKDNNGTSYQVSATVTVTGKAK